MRRVRQAIRAVLAPTIAVALLTFSGLSAHGQARGSEHGHGAAALGTTPVPDVELTENPDPLGSDAEQMAKLTGVAPDLMRAYLERQDAVGELQEKLQETATSFGGMFIDYQPSYQITILAAPGSSETMAIQAMAAAPDLSSNVVVVETDFTEGLLSDAIKEVSDLLEEGGISSERVSLDADIRTGRVVVSAENPEDVQAIRKMVDGAPLSVPADHVVVEQGAFSNLLDSFGGRSLLYTDGSICTGGFTVVPTAGGAGGISSAAHCPNSGVIYGGTITLSFVNGVWGGDQDAQWWLTTNANDLNVVQDSPTTTRSITARVARSAIVVGGAVCHHGVYTDGCGVIASKVYLPPNDGHTYNAHFIRITGTAVQGGDSGCPWFLGTSAYGILKGQNPAGNPVFMAQNYLNAVGVQVKIT